MKLYLVLSTILKFLAAKPLHYDFKNSNFFFENQFNKSFECFKNVLEIGSSEHGLPSLSPLRFNDGMDVVLDGLLIDGLTHYKSTRIDLKPEIVMYVDFVFPKITVSSNYSGKMNILGLYAVYGKGELMFEFLNITASTVVKHNILTPLIASTDTIIGVDSVNFTITKLMDDEDFSKAFSKAASNVITWFINNSQKNISGYLNPKFQKIVNHAIGNLNFLDYLAKIILYSCND
ncbi:hypothetical protein RN001_007069 [Aquatica leii]|uniref:Uncharacterized protein n=1 Tax=Aquatica leii TaxID=1421715 RepID=A0AAN7SNQ8_9COLE|nr:hypothetical protein RN001_007069 [Aquatica leii]